MDEDRKAQLKTAADMVREERRKYNNLLNDYVSGKGEEYNAEDLMRLVASLEAAYNHLLVAIASDGDVYCALKHLSYSVILAGELDKPDVETLYDIFTIISNGKLSACMSCRQEERSANGDNTTN